MIKTILQFSSKTGRLDPRSIMFTLGDIYLYFYSQCPVREAIADLKQYAGRNSDRKVALNPDDLRNLFRQHSYLKYWHLEMFSEKMGIPTGALLLFTRMKANQEHSKKLLNERKMDGKDTSHDKYYDDMKASIESMQKILYNIDDKTVFDIDELVRWSKIFNESGSQLSLDLPPK